MWRMVVASRRFSLSFVHYYQNRFLGNVFNSLNFGGGGWFCVVREYHRVGFPARSDQVGSFNGFCYEEVKFGSRYGELEKLMRFLRSEDQRTAYVITKALSCCAKALYLGVGEKLHSMVMKIGVDWNVYVCSALVDLYGKCRAIWDAQKVFDEMRNRNVVVWNSLISGYVRAGASEVGVGVFLDMVRSGVGLTGFSISAVLVACAHLEDCLFGGQVHCLCVKRGLFENVVVETGLIDLYAKCGKVDLCRKIFDEMWEINVVTWNAMVTAYVLNQQPEEAMVLVCEMQVLGVRPNGVTYNTLLSSFCISDHLHTCRQIHCCIVREGFGSYVYIAGTLVTAYSDCGCSVDDYRKICLSIVQWDQIAWNAVIAGFSQLASGKEALVCFCKMTQAGIDVDFFTFLSLLKATGDMSVLEEGRQIHALVLKTGYATNVFVQNGLVSTYAKCGQIVDSKRIFVSMKEHNLISWNSLISGCANHGHGKEAVALFEMMGRTGVRPDRTTYLSVLSACSHVGLLNKGLEYFDLMKDDTNIEPPSVKHYAVVVDLFGRTGFLDEAESFIDSMPIEPGPSVYKALLSACLVHGDVGIATNCAKKLLEQYPDDPATYVLLSKMLAFGGNWEGSAGLRKLMLKKCVQKKPGYSWV